MKSLVTIKVNGVEQKHEVEPRTLLVHYLREHCKLTGTTLAVKQASAGPAPFCSTAGRQVLHLLAIQADGAEVTTSKDGH